MIAVRWSLSCCNIGIPLLTGLCNHCKPSNNVRQFGIPTDKHVMLARFALEKNAPTMLMTLLPQPFSLLSPMLQPQLATTTMA